MPHTAKLPLTRMVIIKSLGILGIGVLIAIVGVSIVYRDNYLKASYPSPTMVPVYQTEHCNVYTEKVSTEVVLYIAEPKTPTHRGGCSIALSTTKGTNT